MIATSIKFATFAVLVAAVFHTFRIEQPVPSPARSKLRLYDPTYRCDPTVAPIATGLKLRILSYILTKSVFGFAIRRHLLLKNGVTQLRELALHVPLNIGPMFYPLRRLNSAQRLQHDYRGRGANEDVLLQLVKHGNTLNLTLTNSRVLSFHEGYKSIQITPAKVLEVTIQAIDDLQPSYMPFAVWPPSPSQLHAIQFAASASTARYKTNSSLSIWDGVPVAFKDCVNIQGYKNTKGSAYWDKFSKPESYDSEDRLVATFRDLGAIILPPTSMVEGGASPIGYNVYYGGPFNPHNFHHYSGGSSGGSAVAVALGIVPVAIGFDGGGSIRTPASFSGVVGMATGFGRVESEALIGRTMVKAGPLATTVDDAALVFATIASPTFASKRTTSGNDGYYQLMYDGSSIGLPSAHLGWFLEHYDTKDLTGVRLGIFEGWFTDASDDVVKACHDAVENMVLQGATIVPVAIPHIGMLRLAHAILIASEFGSEWDSVYHGYLSSTSSDKNDNDLLEPSVRITVGIGMSLTSVELTAAERLKGWAHQYIQQELFEKLSLDAIITPSTSVTAPRIDPAVLEVGESNTPLQVELMKYAFLANFLGLPSISVPVGMSNTNGEEAGMPIGMMLTSSQWGDDVILRLANSISHLGYLDLPIDYIDIIRLSMANNSLLTAAHGS